MEFSVKESFYDFLLNHLAFTKTTESPDGLTEEDYDMNVNIQNKKKQSKKMQNFKFQLVFLQT